MIELAKQINNQTYQPKSSTVFMVNKPVKREIFAADFVDRVVYIILSIGQFMAILKSALLRIVISIKGTLPFYVKISKCQDKPEVYLPIFHTM
ncbi:hypothetical protein [Bathymodiolus septemdierum thioautotrophic gill symbiont]|uniref:hypothetical protein n=1 Tax=Bathymodiolus septemdierum thioautotrophic gill symbiont TaxID=113267 RepID=UPI0012EE2E44|nr:hypothetical protein [Bathymodiolus septemdierum thioautotrophic gill symbiont]